MDIFPEIENSLSSAESGNKKKRTQYCTFCKNHNEAARKKNHICPYKKCECALCELQRKAQITMRHQQRIWRHQKQKLRPSGQNLGSEPHLVPCEEKGQMCDKCRNHNELVLKKNHQCPYHDCDCQYCSLTFKRRELMKHLQRVRRSNITSEPTVRPETDACANQETVEYMDQSSESSQENSSRRSRDRRMENVNFYNVPNNSCNSRNHQEIASQSSINYSPLNYNMEAMLNTAKEASLIPFSASILETTKQHLIDKVGRRRTHSWSFTNPEKISLPHPSSFYAQKFNSPPGLIPIADVHRHYLLLASMKHAAQMEAINSQSYKEAVSSDIFRKESIEPSQFFLNSQVTISKSVCDKLPQDDQDVADSCTAINLSMNRPSTANSHESNNHSEIQSISPTPSNISSCSSSSNSSPHLNHPRFRAKFMYSPAKYASSEDI